MITDAMRCDHRHRGANTSTAHPAIASLPDALNRVSGCIVTPKLLAVVYANQSCVIVDHLLYTNRQSQECPCLWFWKLCPREGRTLSWRVTGNPHLIGLGKGCRPYAQNAKAG